MDQNFKDRLRDFVKFALVEDVGDGDHTSLSTISAEQSGEAKLLVKEDGLIAGVDVAVEIFNAIDSTLAIEVFIADGSSVLYGDIILVVTGHIHSILKAERLVLNIMQRMSGIATLTATYVKELVGTEAKILDTRKTTPLLRFLEKEAVRIGGGSNHRFGLFDMILIKDNHVDYAGGVTNALQAADKYRRENNLAIPIEIEVRTFAELEEVMASQSADRVMFDNFEPNDVLKAVERVGGVIITEASGGITLETIREYALTGVDYISVGALTHSVKSLDLSLKAKLI